MADSVLMITWGAPVHGREERGLDVFNESMGLYGRFQQEGRIESFDVAILEPNGLMDGFIALRGSAEQLAALRQDEEFRRTTVDASLIVQDLQLIDGTMGEGVARDIAMYSEAISKVPQTA
ncbi:MAG TPA: hypothetical protein VHR40_12685 [Thermoleophilaceae bacterium]|jgi:hypothetical protein|nr:hypothetical protein [Thermoleophilaceae bacterium]